MRHIVMGLAGLLFAVGVGCGVAGGAATPTAERAIPCCAPMTPGPPTPSPAPSVAGGTAGPAPSASPSPGPAPAASPSAGPAARNYDDPAVPIEVAVGERFTITLRELGTAGFRFRYVREPDPRVVVERDSTTSQVAPGLIGSPDMRRWTFEAVGEGRTEIVLQQTRQGTPATGTPSPYGRAESPYAFTVTVRPAR